MRGDPDVDNLFWLTGHSTHLPRLSRPGRRSWRSRRIGYRRCEGSRCIPVVANRVSGMDGQRDGRGGRREAGDGTLGSFLALPRQERGLCGRGALPPRATKRARRWARGGWKLTSGGSVLMALRSDCSLSTAAVCWHDAPAIAPLAELTHSCSWVCLRWTFARRWGAPLGFRDARGSNAVARRRLDAMNAPGKDPRGVR